MWRLDPLGRVGAVRGVVEVGPGAAVSGEEGVEGGGLVTAHPQLDGGACRVWRPALDSLFRGSVVPPVAEFAPTVLPEPSLGLLGADALVAAATRSVAGSGTPAPEVGLGGCLPDDPWNWGDPDDRHGACRGLLVFVGARGPLRVEGGVGQGVLVVTGDLTFTDGARFYGLVLVGGKLTMDGASRLVGLARSAGGFALGSGAEVVASGCWAARALHGVRTALGRPVPLPGAGPLGPS
jgi:hypothetical protein